MRLDRYRNFHKNGIYHIYNRGNDKNNIFLDKRDYIFYLIELRKCLKKYNIVLLSYCLMPNHIHLEARQSGEVSLSKCIGDLHTQYSNYFNKKYNKIGHLFQGRFKAKEIKSEAQILELVFYIHINPVSAKLAEYPEDWEWSSARDYAGLRNGTLCDKKAVLDLLSGLEEYNQIMKDKLSKTKWDKIDGLLFDL